LIVDLALTKVESDTHQLGVPVTQYFTDSEESSTSMLGTYLPSTGAAWLQGPFAPEDGGASARGSTESETYGRFLIMVVDAAIVGLGAAVVVAAVEIVSHLLP
jgi:hypothetical protein